MKILSVGGGSGGHVTPVVAVLREIKALHPKSDIRFWCDKGFAPEARHIMAGFDPSIKVGTVVSGKFRRYQHISRLQHFTVPAVVFPNIRDAFYVVFGVIQSLFRLIFWRPKVVFLKGGFVCLPVGIAAWILRIPIVIHDSDAHPGLTNRILAPLAKRITTGVSLDHYDYPPEKSSYVGIPIDQHFTPQPEEKRQAARVRLGLDPKRPLVVFIGGGLGSRQINAAVARQLSDLLRFTNVVLIAGTKQYDEIRGVTRPDDKYYRLEAFVSPRDLAEILAAADVVVTRAGATALLELAALAKPTIVIPSKRLTWQVKHAKLFVDMQAVFPLDEDRFEKPEDTSLVIAVKRIMGDKALRIKLSKNLKRLAKPNAARDLAETIISVTRKRR